MQFFHTWKGYGALAACHSLAYRIVKRCVILDVTYLMVLDTAQLPHVTAASADFRALGFAEILRMSANPDADLDPKIACRVQGDLDICFGAFVEDQLAGYLWLAFDSIEGFHNRGDSEETGVALAFPEDAVFLYKAFVLPRFRGHGLYADLIRAAGGSMRRHYGTRYIISTSDWTNYAAIRTCHRQGFRTLGRIWRIGLPGWMATVGPRSAAAHGISFGRGAEIQRRPLAPTNFVRPPRPLPRPPLSKGV